MKKTKKILSIILCLFLSVFSLNIVGCAPKDDGKISVVCTIFPEYDWVNNIIGENNENIKNTLLLDDGIDLHSYQPSVSDIYTISTCDLFIYVGGESDSWVKGVLNQATNEDMIVINLMSLLGSSVLEEEDKEGMEGEVGGDGEETEYDEHVWLSLKNAKIICEEIFNKIKILDSENENTYQTNYDNYVGELTRLDNKYVQAVNNKTFDTLVFGDRFPFRYLVNDYGIDYFAAFKGCSAESEASFNTIVFLANKINNLSLPTVCKIEGSNHNIYNTVKQNVTNNNVSVVSYNSMQSITKKEINNGISYLCIMEDNLVSLKLSLGVNE